MNKSQRPHYVERPLFAPSVKGEHPPPQGRGSFFKWHLPYSRSRRNEPDLREVPSNITDGLVLVPIRRIDEAIPHVFGPDTPARRNARA